MPIGDVVKFIKLAMTDMELRKELNSAANREARMELLKARDIIFNDAEFGDGYRSMLFECQSEVAADHLKEFKMWWELLQST